MSTYGSARVRATAAPTNQVYARRRLGAGVILGVVGQLVLAAVLGFVLAGGLGLAVRLMATLFSSLIATPLMFTAGFAFMLKDDSRSFGGGLVLGALISTVLLVIGYFLL